MTLDSARAPAPLVYHPAGHDAELRVAVEDLQAGRWMSTRALLVTTGQDWSLRASRTQVLGMVAARSDVLGRWAGEDPESADLGVLQARAMTGQAVAAHQSGSRQTAQLERAAREASWRAAKVLPADPVPWMCLLALAVVDPEQQRPEHRHPAPDVMLREGPWGLLWQAHARDPFGREAYHRMLRYLLAVHRWSATDFVNYVLPNVPSGSPLAALPLYVSVEQYRTELRKDGARRQWTREPHSSRALAAFESWRAAPAGEQWPVVDLSYLAHALWAGVEMKKASMVFDALGSFASQQPWTSVADAPDRAEDFLYTARIQAYVGRATAMA